MPKKVKQYPEGTYGAWLQMRINSLAGYLGQMKEEIKHDGHRFGSLQKIAAETYAQLTVMQRTMMGAQQQLKMTDRMNEYIGSLINGEVEAHKEDKEYMEPFDSGKLDQTIKSLGMNGKEPPSPEDMLQNLTAMQAKRETTTQERGQRQPEQRQKKEVFPEGTYGAWLQQKHKYLSGVVQTMQEKARDPDWQAANRNVKAPEGQPAYLNTDTEMYIWQASAANFHAQMSVMERFMTEGKMKLTDKLPPDHMMENLKIEAGQKSATKEFMEPFHVDMLDKTADYLGLSWKKSPGMEYTQRRAGELREAREQAKQEHEAEKTQLQKDRQAAADLLVGTLKQSTQKSFVGKLKSFFVGNSKEYKEAFKAVQDIAGGKADPKEAKDKIWKYLDLRGNKVRDHQYGRDRFDAMLSALALVTSKEEFAKRCGAIDNARRVRSKGTFTGKIDPEKYSLAAQKRREEALIRDDPRRIRFEDARYKADYLRYLSTLKNAKTATPELEAFALEHPGVREAARAIAEQNGLEIKIPKTPDNLSKEDKEALQEQQRGAREMADNVSREAAQPEPSRQPQQPSMSREM